jgi:hypothetical protein
MALETILLGLRAAIEATRETGPDLAIGAGAVA